ncbi:MAG TPA: hypothetical protein VGL72_17295, partial [Bryobacteraceae bacterium]
MSSSPSPAGSRVLSWLTALFILGYFIFFTYRGLSSYFTFDDGTTVIAVLKPFETPWWRDLLHVLTVFTAAFRPLTTLYWRPLYALFGFHPLPYRIVFQLLMAANIGVAYVLARRLDATRAAAALTALLFSYNASTIDLYYDTCLVGDVMCFFFCGLALIAFTGDRPRIVAGIVCFLLALDSKEVAVTFPGILLFYYLLYRLDDFRDQRRRLRVGGLLLGMFAASAVYLAIKVADMSHNDAYAPHPTVGFLLSNLAHYLEILLYFPEKTFSVPVAILILAAVVALGAVLRVRPAIFGVLFFGTALIPVAAIPSRAGYAAYVAYFGLALSAGTLLDAFRSRIPVREPRAQTAAAVAFFLAVAIILGFAHAIKRQPTTEYYEWSTPAAMALMEGFEQTVPEFPPGA